MNTTSSDFSDWEYRNIALAVVTQCAVLVRQLAVNGQAPKPALQACLTPVFDLDPESVAALYPQVSAFNQGIRVLQESFDSAGLREHADEVRYLLGMLVLQQHLQKQPGMQAAIGQRLSAMKSDMVAAPEETEIGYSTEQITQLARLYQDTISKLSFRIHVAGQPEHLRNAEVADQIRALLLAGIRSAVLWHQLGGRRWHLFFYKKRIRDCLSQVRRKLISSSPASH